MTNALKKLLLGSMLAISTLAAPFAQAREVKIAVTSLAYEEKVQEYFRTVDATSKSSVRAASHETDFSRREAMKGERSSTYSSYEGTYSYIERGELRKFTADIKGELLKTGYLRVTEGKPYTAKDMEKLYDIVDRIKKGMYPGADYVLFGTVSSIQFREEANPILNTDTVSYTLSLELVGDFSLISTKTFEVKAAFSAMGEGQDTKLVTSAGANIVLNRGKVISEVSKSLGVDVIRQVEEQIAINEGYAPPVRGTVIQEKKPDTEVIRFR
ncbi:MAG: penicillin-binding protein activator LpoB [Betaproteobacteria bacterium]|nr:penicillin-binding protein activator LpoB [Betaproteobacteria bacterium]